MSFVEHKRVGEARYMLWVQGKLNRHIRSRQAQLAQAELMQRVQVRTVSVQAEIQPERRAQSW